MLDFDRNVTVGPRVAADCEASPQTAKTTQPTGSLHLQGHYARWETVARFPVPEEQRRPGWFEFQADLTVVRGQVGLIVVDAEGEALSPFSLVGKSGRRTTTLQFGLTGTPAAVLLRNWDTEGECRVDLHSAWFRDTDGNAFYHSADDTRLVANGDRATFRGRYDPWGYIVLLALPRALRRPGLFQFQGNLAVKKGRIGYVVVDADHHPLTNTTALGGTGSHHMDLTLPVTGTPAFLVFRNWDAKAECEVEFLSAAFRDDATIWTSPTATRTQLPNETVRVRGRYEKWGYVAFLSVPKALRRPGRLEFQVTLKVLRGEIGFALMDGEQTLLSPSTFIGGKGPHPVGMQFDCERAPSYVVLRNWDADGDVEVELSEVSFSGDKPEEPVKEMVHHEVFSRFNGYSGSERTGTDWIGMRYKASWGCGMPGPSLPPLSEEYFEWIDVLEAADAAGSQFTMLELGAGYGRWGIKGALAAKQKGIPRVHVRFVEGEPQHVAWLQEAVELNGLDPNQTEIIHGAISHSDKPVPFLITSGEWNINNWWGQQIPAGTRTAKELGRTYLGHPVYSNEFGQEIVYVKSVTFASVTADLDLIDLVDIDIQGAERELFENEMDTFSRKVRRVHIGTHGMDIENRIRQIFRAAGWECRWDFAWNREQATPYGVTRFQDGVQAWLNPRLRQSSPATRAIPSRPGRK